MIAYVAKLTNSANNVKRSSLFDGEGGDGVGFVKKSRIFARQVAIFFWKRTISWTVPR